MRFADFLGAVAAKSPSPGGGAVASACGTLAAALAQMVVNYSIGKKNLAEQQEELTHAATKLERARAVLLELAQEDAEAYALLNELQKLPDTDARKKELPGATRLALQVPQSVAAAAIDLLRLFEQLAPITNKHLRSDLAIAAVLAEATVRCANWNVLINAAAFPPPERAGVEEECRRTRVEATERAARVERACAV